MRYAKDHKAKVREHIVRVAADLVRAEGLERPSVPGIMQKAGLTHGGFYGHFRDRGELVADAVRLAGADTAARVFAHSPDLESLLRGYLSERHLDAPQSGCVVAALGTEGRRGEHAVRGAFAEVAEGLLGLVDDKLGGAGIGQRPSERALAVAAQMVGAIVLARLVADRTLARRILTSGRKSATALAGAKRRARGAATQNRTSGEVTR